MDALRLLSKSDIEDKIYSLKRLFDNAISAGEHFSTVKYILEDIKTWESVRSSMIKDNEDAVPMIRFTIEESHRLRKLMQRMLSDFEQFNQHSQQYLPPAP